MTVPIMECLRSCIALSSSEERSIRLAIPGLEVEVEHIEEEILRLKATLDALTSKYHMEKDRLCSHRALLAPIRRLPPEILGEIFIRSLPSSEFVTPDPDCAPLVLGKVCTHWRTVSLHTPRLWASLKLNFQDDLSISRLWTSSFEILIETWLARSGNLPLSLHIKGELPESLYAMLHSHYTLRCRNLKILLLSGSRFLKPFVHAGLEEITIFLDHHEDFNVIPCIEAPNLRRAGLRQIKGSLHKCSCLLQWSQLTHLSLYFEGLWLNSLEILSQCSNLQELNLVLRADDSTDASPPTTHSTPGPIILPQLRVLVILIMLTTDEEVESDYIVEPYLNVLVLSRLQSLTFLSNCIWPHSSFLQMAARSSCHIQKLTIAVTSVITERQQMELTRAFPSLQSFSTDDYYRTRIPHRLQGLRVE